MPHPSSGAQPSPGSGSGSGCAAVSLASEPSAAGLGPTPSRSAPAVSTAAEAPAARSDRVCFEPELVCLPDAGAVGAWVATRLLAQRREMPSLPLGLATGRTMEPVYAALARQFAALPEQVRRATRQGWLSFNLDEYVGLGVGDSRSFAAEMRRRLVAPLALDPLCIHLPDGLAAEPGVEACRYAASVRAAGGIGLQLLGLGSNGHLGFNEPPSGPAVACRVVDLSAETRLQNAAAFAGDPRAVPERAITLGLEEILAARSLLLVVTGAAKASMLRRVLSDPPSDAVPASWIRLHPAAVVVVDEAALG